MDKQSIKQKICIHLQQIVTDKKQGLMQAIALAKESRDNDSKSSVGDKHETSRAMTQIEIDKLEVQLDKILILEKELSLIHPEKVHSQIEPGSLVISNQGNYFISIGFGKVELEIGVYYCISLASPIGKLLYKKEKGDVIQFNGKEIIILEIA